MHWPNKVWEPTGTAKDGKTLWSSRIVTREDRLRRQRYEFDYLKRQLERET